MLGNICLTKISAADHCDKLIHFMAWEVVQWSGNPQASAPILNDPLLPMGHNSQEGGSNGSDYLWDPIWCIDSHHYQWSAG